jgi:DNA methyltransferase 1-associated protein 1
MTSLDVRDMLDLPNSAGPRPAKKQKTSGPRPNLKGLQREVQSLGGDNPIAIVPVVPSFKKRRLASRKPAARWELKPFKNSARTDGLILRHWRRKAEVLAPTEGADGDQEQVKAEDEIEDSVFAKFNVQVNLPKYDDEQYDANLRNDDWSKDETDYLMGLAEDYDLRWPLISDRYEYEPAKPEVEGESDALVPQRKTRSMEDIKARYYDVAAKMMAIHRPIQFMSQAEFSLHQLMTSFNPEQERVRKRFAETAMSRSAEERREEESLLIELKRIMARSEKLNEERKELYSRLEAPPSSGNVGIYTTSQGLQQLLGQLMNANRSKQRKSLLGNEGVSPAAGPSGQQNPSLDRRESTNRESISGPTGATGANKKGPANPTERRKLSPEEESLYGVSHHERLTGGPGFRHDKVTRQITNKSAVQAAKISNTLTELEIPARLVMPTADVTSQYEVLLTSINTLLDTKKIVDKLDSEIKLAEAQKLEREKKERREKGEPEPEGADTGEADGDGQADSEMVDADAEEGEDDFKTDQGEKERSAAPSARPSGSLHKRSASVLSQVSDKSTKRQKK